MKRILFPPKMGLLPEDLDQNPPHIFHADGLEGLLIQGLILALAGNQYGK